MRTPSLTGAVLVAVCGWASEAAAVRSAAGNRQSNVRILMRLSLRDIADLRMARLYNRAASAGKQIALLEGLLGVRPLPNFVPSKVKYWDCDYQPGAPREIGR